ncbi:MAG: hypothetical protein QOE05_287 [Actinomycetota bacterium]|jgi:hypothetical protein|nr:hypothetical protein [Actinomycetota bacterium]
MATWRDYQEQVADHFRVLGFHAETDAIVVGARATHAIDVLVKFNAAGVPVTWAVECKRWSRPVPKERVLVLAGVIDDIGADRGLLVADSGFQSGAISAARHSRITLTSLPDLATDAADELRRASTDATLRGIADLASAVRRLWHWTLPQCQPPLLPVDAVLEAAARSFDLQTIVAPRLVSDELPVQVPLGGERVTALTGEEAVKLLDAELIAVRRALQPLASRVVEAADSARQGHQQLSDAAMTLVDVGRLLHREGRLDDVRAHDFVAAMVAIDAASTELVTGLPDAVRDLVRGFMQHLFSSTYNVSETEHPDWEVERRRLVRFLEDIARKIDDVDVVDIIAGVSTETGPVGA